MSDFNAKMIAKSQKILEQDKDLEQKILDQCVKKDEAVSPDEHAKTIMEALFRLQQIRPEYLASKNELSDKIFESPEALEAFLSALKEYKDVEKEILLNPDEIDKNILDLEKNSMFLNPSKIEEAKKLTKSDFTVGKEVDEDLKQAQDPSSESLLKDTAVSDEEIEESPEMESLEPEQENPTQENQNNNFSEEVDFEGASNKEIKEKLSSNQLKEEKTLLMKDELKDYTYNKKSRVFVNNETGKPFIKVEGFSWMSYIPMGNKDKEYHSVTRASAGHNPSVEAMKAVLKMVEPKTIRTFPTDNVEENQEKFRKALQEMKDEGVDLNEISIGFILNKKNPELKKILEEVKNPAQEFKVGLSNDDNLKEKLKGEKAAEAFKNKQENDSDYSAEKERSPTSEPTSEPKSEPTSEPTSAPINSQERQAPDFEQMPTSSYDDYSEQGRYQMDNEPPMYDPSSMYDEPPMYDAPPMQDNQENTYQEPDNNSVNSSGNVMNFDELMASDSDEFLSNGIKTRFGVYTPEQELEIGKRVFDIAEERGTTALELVSPQNENKETMNLGEAMSNVLLKGTGDYKLHLKKLKENSIENQENDLKEEVENELTNIKNKSSQSPDGQQKKNRKNSPRK